MNNHQIADFFVNARINVLNNTALRIPQQEGYINIQRHFEEKSTPCYVQLPVGCGKTGLMGLTPFGIADGRVLIVAPNLTIRNNIVRELNISDANNFYSKRGVFEPVDGPFLSELKTGANRHDCDNAHIVVGNIQQFSGENNRWYEHFDRDYFRMILVDEGHHNVADTWQRLFEYFENAKVISFTATPMRSDGQVTSGERVYSFSYTRSMMMRYISTVDALYVSPEDLRFTIRDEDRTLTLDEVRSMREHDWFSKGVAMSETCNRHIVQASINRLEEVRRHGTPRQIIAAACSIRHANQVASLYSEYGLRAEVLHSELSSDDRDRVESALRNGQIDVVVQVNILGEGYDLGSLSVAAVFRPYRSLSPYIQFLGRILRLAVPDVTDSPGNHVYIVSHVGLNDERWWEDFRQFDKEDQQFFGELTAGDDEMEESNGGRGPRMTLRPFMRILNETVRAYVQKTYLREIDDTMVQEVLTTIRNSGFDPSEFGLDERMMRSRLEMANRSEREVLATPRPVQPQQRREALKPRVYQEARSIADVVCNRLDLRHVGQDLVRHYPGRGSHNAAVLIALASAAQNRVMGIESGDRENASMEQLEMAINASADITDSLTAAVRSKIRE